MAGCNNDSFKTTVRVCIVQAIGDLVKRSAFWFEPERGMVLGCRILHPKTFQPFDGQRHRNTTSNGKLGCIIEVELITLGTTSVAAVK